MLSGVASGTITQNLPFGLHISPGDEVDIYADGRLAAKPVVQWLSQLIGFTSNGTGQIYTVPVPEPGSLAALLSLAVAGGVAFAWRRRRGHGC